MRWSRCFSRLLLVTVLLVGAQVAVFIGAPFSRADSHAAVPQPLSSVDIVVPVHDALSELRMLLASLRAYTKPGSYRLFLVDDSSNPETRAYLDTLASDPEVSVPVKVLRAQVRGYSSAVNCGITSGTAEYVVILNSDVIVTDGWLPALVRTLGLSPRIAAVSPLSNAASYQSVPQVHDKVEGKLVWSKNPLPPGWSANSVARAVRQLSDRSYPAVPFLNGFCICFRRAVLEEVGLLDTQSFPFGYGEENDLLLRIHKQGYQAVLDDATYVFHHKTRSFTASERASLAPQGRERLLAKHSRDYVMQLERNFQNITQESLKSLRNRLTHALRFPELFSGSSLRILFLLPSSATGGGSTSVVREALAFEELGMTARILLWDKSMTKFKSVFPEATHLFHPWPKHASEEQNEELYRYGTLFHVVIATIWTSVNPMLEMWRRLPSFLPVYYVQDYEPWFYAPNSSDYYAAARSYEDVKAINGVMYGKSTWIQLLLRNHHGAALYRVPAGIEQVCSDSTIQQRLQRPIGKLRICAMIRPSTPRRNALLTLRLLASMKRLHGSAIHIATFGSSSKELSEWAEKGGFPDALAFPFEHLGVLNRSGISTLFAESDVFVDLSVWQAFGRSAAEAMTCGCIPMITNVGGANEFVVHGHNGILVNVTAPESLLPVFAEFTNDLLRLQLMQLNAVELRHWLKIDVAALARMKIFMREWEMRRGISFFPPWDTLLSRG